MTPVTQPMSGALEASLLAMACMVDYAIGDPRWLPHPVRLIGRAISGGEALLRTFAKSPSSERVSGAVLTIAVVGLACFFTMLLQNALLSLVAGADPFSVPAIFGFGSLILLAATTLALRGLNDAAAVVITDLEEGNLEKARHDLSMIVGRDTAPLSESGCTKAAIETVAENLSDGVIAPLFWFVIGGLPLAMAYKAVNTLDSMIGHRNERYRHFGWAAARLDDLANLIPARIAGWLIVISSLTTTGASACAAWRIMWRDGRNHPSPNSGVPEAAMAGALGVQLGGPSTYGGMIVTKPTIGDGTRPLTKETGRRALGIMKRAALLGMLLAIGAKWGLS